MEKEELFIFVNSFRDFSPSGYGRATHIMKNKEQRNQIQEEYMATHSL
jgi:hypothetical protein